MGPETPAPIDLPFRIFLKIFIAALVVYAVMKSAAFLQILLLAMLLATTLYPVEQWFVKRGVPRWLTFFLISLVTLGVFGSFLFILLPKVIDQFGTLPEQFARVTKELAEKIDHPALREKLEAALKDPPKVIGNIPEHLVAVGSSIAGTFFDVGFMLILALYFVADGSSTYRWIRAFFAAEVREKLDRTADEVSAMVSAYVAGQLITSGLVAIYVFVLLKLTHVPAALAVAVLAAVFDILPMIGFLVSLGIAGLLALTVSGPTVLIVTIAFVAYHFLENYVIVPRIYGNRMRLSGLVVLLSLAVAVEVGGIIAGVLALPIVATYPIIERIWLERWFGARTLAVHAAKPSKTKRKSPAGRPALSGDTPFFRSEPVG